MLKNSKENPLSGSNEAADLNFQISALFHSKVNLIILLKFELPSNVKSRL